MTKPFFKPVLLAAALAIALTSAALAQPAATPGPWRNNIACSSGSPVGTGQPWFVLNVTRSTALDGTTSDTSRILFFGLKALEAGADSPMSITGASLVIDSKTAFDGLSGTLDKAGKASTLAIAWEANPTPLIQAMAAGLKVVLTVPNGADDQERYEVDLVGSRASMTSLMRCASFL